MKRMTLAPKFHVPDLTTETLGIIGKRGSGKALALDTSIATPSGWTTMGEIQPGDTVYDERGEERRVVWTSPIYKDHECFEIVFDDGSTIVADAEHRWLSDTLAARRAAGLISLNRRRGIAASEKPHLQPRTFPQVLTTRQLAETLHVTVGECLDRNHSIKSAASLVAPERELPIDPYVLGAWLGDGSSDSSYITNADQEIFDEILRAGYSLGEPLGKKGTGKAAVRRIGARCGVPLHKSLRLLGLLKNKHIPLTYLRASTSQRLALLQGLMDTDGWVSAKSNSCEITSSYPQLARGIIELIVSLGWKTNPRTRIPRCNGVDGRPSCRMVFRPTANIFRLSRKAARLHPAAQSGRALRRMIVDVRLVPSVPVRCIAVDAPSHLFLAGRSMIPTHNSHTGTLVVEELLDLNSQVVVLDPTGGWWGLRAGANGKKEDGYSIPIFGGNHGDIPIQDSGGAVLAEYVIENRLSCVLDFGSFSKAGMRRFVADFLERFYQLKNKKPAPVHVVIDEVDLFAPQRADEPAVMRSMGAVNDLVLRGRQRGVGLTLISQRPARINKDILTQVEILICFRLTGPQDIKAFGEWIEYNGTRDEQKQILGTLSSLPRGTGFFWAPGLSVLERVEFREKRTFDSSATPDRRRVKPPKTLRDVDLGELSEAMQATVQQVKQNDPKELRAEVARLKKELEKKVAIPPKIQAAPAPPRLPKRVEVPIMTSRQEKKIDRLTSVIVELRGAYDDAVKGLKVKHDLVVLRADEALNANADLRKRLRELASGANVAERGAGGTARTASRVGNGASAQTATSRLPRRPEPPKKAAPQGLSDEAPKLGKGERKCMIAIAQYGDDGVTKKQITQMTSYKRSTRDAYVLRLRNAGFITEHGDRVVRTDEGVAWLGHDYEELPTGDALYQHWIGKLPEGQRIILELARGVYPEDLDKDEIPKFARSTRDAYILRLKNRRLIEEPSRGTIRMADSLATEEQ